MRHAGHKLNVSYTTIVRFSLYLVGTNAEERLFRNITKNQRIEMQQGATHWTSDHATTKLGARFHLRSLFLRQQKFSIDDLNFIVAYLMNETTIAEQVWWKRLSHLERLETANRMKMQNLRRGEEHVIRLTLVETARSCILLYGNAEARPVDVACRPVLHFTEGSVIGNLGAPVLVPTQHLAPSSEQSQLPSPSSTANTLSDTKWRRVNREISLQQEIHLYQQIVVSGPADYIVLLASDVQESSSDAIDRHQWAKVFGFERFAEQLREVVFQPGTIIVQEGHQLETLYFVIEGECHASVERDDTNCSSLALSTDVHFGHTKPSLTSAEAQLRHTRKFHWSDDSHVSVASLGPKSIVGDISFVLELPEPFTVRAVTTVNTLSLSIEDFLHECSDQHDPMVLACIEKLQSTACDTLRFGLERIQVEAANEHYDQSRKIDALCKALSQKQLVATTSKHPTSTLPAATSSSSNTSFQSGTTAATQSSRVVSLPPVVQKHTAANVDTFIATVSDVNACLAGKTWQQREAVQAFTSLQYPVAGKSLGDHVVMPNAANGNGSSSSITSQSLSRPRQSEDFLFLFPTMTQRRHLHGKTLPLLPRYRGYDVIPAE